MPIDTSYIFDPRPGLYPDTSGRALRMCKFISRLRLWEGEWAGQRFKINDFQQAIVRRIYGQEDEDGERKVKVAAIWIPRGNAKTTLAAALSLGHFLGPENEPGGQIVTAAADRENAGIAFNMAHQMLRQDDVLDGMIRPIESRKLMIHERSSSTYKAISTEAYSKHGLNVSFFLADEIHAWPPTEARKLWKVITDSMVKRRQALTIIISTAGEGMGGLAWEMWDYSHKVARGEIEDETFAPIIFAAPDGDGWKDPKTWYFANPGLKAGFINLKDLEAKVKRAQYFPTDVNDFKRFHLNIWQDGASAPWIDMKEVYDKAEEGVGREVLLGSKCYLGVDLSSVEDLTAVVAIFPDENEGEERGYDVLAHFFLPEMGLKRKQDLDQANYLKWADEGYLSLTPGNRIDQKAILEYIKALREDFEIVDIAVDRWNSTAFVTALQDEDFEVVEFGQGYESMAGPVKELKAKILGFKFRHGNNPILRMCFANVVTEKDAAENEKFTKAKARGRIDGATASAMGIGRVLSHDGKDDEYQGMFKRRMKEGAEIKSKPQDDGRKWDWDILNDMNHPLFAEHKKRFERHQDRMAALEGDGWR